MLGGWIDFNFNVGLGSKAKILLCEKTHKEFHEHYREEVGGCEYGPFVESGCRCKKCGRKWPDPVAVERRRNQEVYKMASEWHAYFGDADRIDILISGNRENPLEHLQLDYDMYREIFNDQEDFCDESDPDARDIGPIENKFFVFCEDLKRDRVFKVENKLARWNPDGTQDFECEDDLLGNWPGHQYPMHPLAKEVWDKRRMNYDQFIERLKKNEEKWAKDKLTYSR